jgi:hypothetical protein
MRVEDNCDVPMISEPQESVIPRRQRHCFRETTGSALILSIGEVVQEGKVANVAGFGTNQKLLHKFCFPFCIWCLGFN